MGTHADLIKTGKSEPAGTLVAYWHAAIEEDGDGVEVKPFVPGKTVWIAANSSSLAAMYAGLISIES